MAGGDGSQALVAGVAAAHDLGFVCVPAGTRNHLAMDLGLDRDDVIGALDAFGPAVERRIDLGWSMTRCSSTTPRWASTPRSCSPRPTATTRSGTALELLPEMLGPHAAPFDLRFVGPDGSEHQSAHLILISNNRYELCRASRNGPERSRTVHRGP